MINTKRIEIVAHLLKTLLPPGKTVFLHFLPIIGRETPVLTIHRKMIRRRTGLQLHVIKFGRYPCIYTVTINPDRNIAFDDNTIFVSIINRITELLVQVKLKPAIKIHFFVSRRFWLEKLFNFCFLINRVRFPLRSIGSFIFIPQIAKCGVWFEPFPIFFNKFFALFIFQAICTKFTVNFL